MSNGNWPFCHVYSVQCAVCNVCTIFPRCSICKQCDNWDSNPNVDFKFTHLHCLWVIHAFYYYYSYSECFLMELCLIAAIIYVFPSKFSLLFSVMRQMQTKTFFSLLANKKRTQNVFESGFRALVIVWIIQSIKILSSIAIREFTWITGVQAFKSRFASYLQFRFFLSTFFPLAKRETLNQPPVHRLPNNKSKFYFSLLHWREKSVTFYFATTKVLRDEDIVNHLTEYQWKRHFAFLFSNISFFLFSILSAIDVWLYFLFHNRTQTIFLLMKWKHGWIDLYCSISNLDVCHLSSLIPFLSIIIINHYYYC